MPDIQHAGCLAHARRKFSEAQKARGKNTKPGSADVALGYIRKIYAVESEAKRKGLSGDNLLYTREEKAKPIIDDFFKWLSKKSLQVVPQRQTILSLINICGICLKKHLLQIVKMTGEHYCQRTSNLNSWLYPKSLLGFN